MSGGRSLRCRRNLSCEPPLSSGIGERQSMSEQTVVGSALPAHGGARLPAVEVETYNVALKDKNGFVGDRASKRALRDFIEDWRKPLREIGRDPFGDKD